MVQLVTHFLASREGNAGVVLYDTRLIFNDILLSCAMGINFLA
ncbi:hypothetical protein [Vibrio aestuarianus]|uniref:Uncharacterized protein n=1 Tax=Vibrio aestuarianus TaxID=28171 RepID=A0AAX3TZG3_9VIBR|nr:hypothetical protein [Vibrio aestuarianus]WGK80607.1 hypothetical protein PYE51_07970 [Vibrio aestuarianus]